MRINGLSCCGVAEISELSVGQDPADKLWNMCVDRHQVSPVEGFHYRCRYIMFTQAAMSGEGGAITRQIGYGFEFAQFIRDTNLGEVIDTIPPGINPNSRNEVKVWMWIPDMAAVRAWLVAEVARREYKWAPPAPLSPVPTDLTYEEANAQLRQLLAVAPERPETAADNINTMRAFLRGRLSSGNRLNSRVFGSSPVVRPRRA